MPRGRFGRVVSRVVIVVALVLGAVVGFDRIGYDPAPYLADLALLEAKTAEGYANLEWQATRKVVDPVALHRLTDSLIRHAGAKSEARKALHDFGRAFQDGHFAVIRPTPAIAAWIEAKVTGRSDAPIRMTSDARTACRAMGFEGTKGEHSMLWVLPNRTGRDDVAERPFPGMMLPLEDGKEVGVVRIASFGTAGYLDGCMAAWPEARRMTGDSICGDPCREFLWLAGANHLLNALDLTLQEMRQYDAVVVDLTGNGGGTDWVNPAARLFTPVPLRGHTLGVIRHPHFVPMLTARRDRIAALAADPELAPEWRATLDSARLALTARLAEVQAPCDRSAIWREGVAALRCTQLATTGEFTTGPLAYLPPIAARLPGATDLFGPAQFQYREGVYQGRLFVLMDRHTASAAEDFAVMLRDNGAALLVGERTYGAGCGQIGGDTERIRLPASGLAVRMPNCARIRRDGTNEVAGITPDLPVAWEESDPALRRAEKVLEAIRSKLP